VIKILNYWRQVDVVFAQRSLILVEQRSVPRLLVLSSLCLAAVNHEVNMLALLFTVQVKRLERELLGEVKFWARHRG
jgi:hypothetical protein